MTQAVSVTQLRALVDAGKITPEDIASKVQAGEIELHDDRPRAADTPIADPKAQPDVLSGRYGNEGKFNDTFVDRVKAIHNVGVGAGKGVIGTGYHVAKMLGLIDANPDFEKALESENTAQTVGKVGETIAEFSAGEGAATGILKVAPKLAKVAEIPLLGTALKGAAVGGGTSIATGRPEEAGSNALVGAAAPVVMEGLGLLAKGAGSKILSSKIKPTLADRKDGFSSETIAKEGLGGLSLQDMADSVKQKIGDLYEKAKAMRGNATGSVNFDDAALKAEAELLADPRNARYMKQIKSAIDEYIANVREVAKTAGFDTRKIDPATANLLKSSFGKAGSFAAGDDATAREIVANALFSKLKVGVEDASQGGLKAVNERISKLIPVERAIYRRLSVAGNNEAVGLLPFIALTAGKLGDAALALLQKSVGAGTALYKGGAAAAEAAPAAAPVVLGITNGRRRTGASGSY